MSRTRWIGVLFFGALALLIPRSLPAHAPAPLELTAAQLDSVNFDTAKAIAKLEASIKGREGAPAESVWKNIKTLKGMPAGRMPRIMDVAFSKSLGVNCLHCHVAGDWDSDDKRPKRVAREMWVFMRDVNTRLGDVPELASKEPAINCTTCHRGDVKPATSLGK
jgi:hypothetical protein